MRLRVARPTDDLDALVRQYRDGLGLREVGRFDGHDGFDGVILALGDSESRGDDERGWEIEFTREHGSQTVDGSSPEHLWVFYVGDRDEVDRYAARMLGAEFQVVASNNPYWDRHGRTFVDRDGYRVVVAVPAAYGRAVT